MVPWSKKFVKRGVRDGNLQSIIFIGYMVTLAARAVVPISCCFNREEFAEANTTIVGMMDRNFGDRVFLGVRANIANFNSARGTRVN